MDMDHMTMGLTLEQVKGLVDEGTRNDIMRENNCTFAEGSCDEILEGFLEHPLWFCDGTPHTTPGGNWTGHVWPGCIFLVWATHWMFAAYRAHFEARLRREPYVGRSAFPLLWFKPNLEGIIKSTFPLITITLELWLAHASWRQLVCRKDEARAGHFKGNTLNNWQHAWMYVGFLFSGWVDLVADRVDLPQGTPSAFLSIAFAAEAVLMGLHKKHTPMDVIVHEVLTWGMMACMVFSALEAAWPRSFLLTCGRIASTYLQGILFIAAARVLYEPGAAQWDTVKDTDLGPVMAFVNLSAACVILVTGSMLGVYCIMHRLYKAPPEVAPSGQAQPRDMGADVDEAMPRLPVATRVPEWE